MTESESVGSRLPHEPPLVTAHLSPVGGRIGPTVEDFHVEEIPAYLPSGEGEHRFVNIEKRSLSTPELVTLVARAAQVGERDIGYAGLKDKHAITRQWLSLPRKSLPAEQWKLPATVAVREESYHGNKLRTGHLHGNRFVIRLVDLHSDAAERLPELLDVLRRGLMNAFGEQRFGRGGSNIDAAVAWLQNPRSLRGNRARFLSKLYPSVLQSEFFNRYLSLRLDLGLDSLLLGEIVRLEGTGSNFVVQDLEKEQSRFERGELHPQGPMFGPKMRPSEHRALELERRLLEDAGLTETEWSALGSHAPGTRRDVRLLVPDMEALFETSTDNQPCLRLMFSLPSGCYATQVVRELTHTAWFSQHKVPIQLENTEEEGKP